MRFSKILCFLVLLLGLAGCAENESKGPVLIEESPGTVEEHPGPTGERPGTGGEHPGTVEERPGAAVTSGGLPDEMSFGNEILAQAPALPDILKPEAAGILVKETDRAVIDYSNTTDGYVMVCFKEETERRLKVQVKGPSTTYTYNIASGEWETFPLSDGNGAYQISVYENVEGSKYATVLSAKVTVELKDEFAPFLRPNQYVNYGDAELTIKEAAVVTAGKTTELEKVKAVYEYVIHTLTYDKELAKTVKSGYLPDLDRVLESKKGICFDYAALMTGMLRSQSVPCKLVVGYAGEVYHAWISVYTEKDGWIDSVIYFDGASWKRMDPTFASSGSQSKEIMEYIGDGENYKEKYLY
ncbi:MAG: transglutaminase-like domain-containing protein [Lachnospiraceae bacterium]|nr:transglutaminase-like domain-containing protein [Lachnospiraceae bacterium]